MRCSDCGSREVEPDSPYSGQCYYCGRKNGSDGTAAWLETLPAIPQSLLRMILRDCYSLEEWRRYVGFVLRRVQQLRSESTSMNCACGYNLGRVTLHTTGLCPVCGRSKWLQLASRMVPKSEAIARGLNRRGSPLCVHRTSTCFTRCGVRLRGGQWSAIDPARRQEWFSEVNQIQVDNGKGPFI